jgi:hypothetical protein
MRASRNGVVGLAVALAAVLALGVGRSLFDTGGPAPIDVSATESRPLGHVRAANVRIENEYLLDSAYETCQARGVDQLARLLHVAPKAELVARAFARHYEPAFRRGAFEGCLSGLLEGSAKLR